MQPTVYHMVPLHCNIYAKCCVHDHMQRLVDELAVCIDAAKVVVPEPLQNSATAGTMLRRLQTAQNQLTAGTPYRSDALYSTPTRQNLQSPSSSGGSSGSTGRSLSLTLASAVRACNVGFCGAKVAAFSERGPYGRVHVDYLWSCVVRASDGICNRRAGNAKRSRPAPHPT